MAFDLYSDVILTRDVDEQRLRAGDVATAVERHAVSGVTDEGYSLELFDMMATPSLSSPSRPVPSECRHQPIDQRRARSARNPHCAMVLS